MTTNKKMGSKLANSVRQAKEQQTQETAAPLPQKMTPTVTVEKETITYFQPSRRVWPD